MTEPLKAKIFISCGQRTEKERSIANQVAGILESKGFDPYIAVQEQSLSGLVENVFHNQLKKSEYFLFIDFRREKLKAGKKPKYRGSLFSHQELAVATFLGFGERFMGFVQEGIARDGISIGLHRRSSVDQMGFRIPEFPTPNPQTPLFPKARSAPVPSSRSWGSGRGRFRWGVLRGE
jgi:hypothetical protein